MEWDDFRYVLALARAGTLSGAATELGVVRTTVGRRLDVIEEQMGVRLFDRTPDGFVPTAAGQDLADVAKGMEAEILSAEGRVLGRDAQLQGKLRVSTIDFIFRGFVDVFGAFADRYPGIELTVCSSYDTVSLRRREADVAIRLSNSPPEHLVGRKLGALRFGIYGSRDLVKRIGADAPLKDYPWVRSDERVDDGTLTSWLEQHAPGHKVTMRFDSYPVLLAAVVAGIGVHVLSRVDGDAHPDLLPVGSASMEETRDLWALTLSDLRTNTRVRAFMDHMYESMRGRL